MGNRHQKNSHRSSDELFFSLFEQSNDGIVICDYDLRIIEWNKAMERISGFSTDEVIGMSSLSYWKKYYRIRLIGCTSPRFFKVTCLK